MACEPHLNSIHETVDGTIGSIRRAELAMHVAHCDPCRALLVDLQRIHDAAAALPALDAPDRAWLQIAGRLRQEGRIRQGAPVAPARRAYLSWRAAAAAVVFAAAPAVMLLRPGAPAAPTPATATPASGAATTPDPKTVETVQNEVAAAQQQFEKAIAELEKIAKANQAALDSNTSATIETNLGIIDQAIAENRAAVKSEPASVAARETLFEALRQKVSLLQDTISVINEMRKGNNAGAAQLVNKS